MYRHRFGEQIIEAKADVLHHHKGHKAGTEQQQYGFDDLYPGGRQHAAKQNVHHHQHANQYDSDVIVQTKQQLNQLTCTNHLRDQIQRNHHQGTTGGQNTDWPLLQTIRRNVCKGVTTQVTQTLSNQEQNNWPADQEAE